MNYALYESAEIKTNAFVEQSNNLTYSVYLWRPGLTNIFPPGLLEIKFLVWWLLHYLRIFPNRDYCVLLILDKGKTLIHRSCAFPRYFRFPFMRDNDLQIGDTFTDGKCRGKGLATYAILKIAESLKMKNRKFWYITDENNKPSVRVIERCGFYKVGYGERTKLFGSKFLGSFVLRERL